jgi:hypothetical protein
MVAFRGLIFQLSQLRHMKTALRVATVLRLRRQAKTVAAQRMPVLVVVVVVLTFRRLTTVALVVPLQMVEMVETPVSQELPVPLAKAAVVVVVVPEVPDPVARLVPVNPVATTAVVQAAAAVRRVAPVAQMDRQQQAWLTTNLSLCRVKSHLDMERKDSL